MRLVNDKSEQSTGDKVDPVSVLMFSILISLGSCVGFLAGLPMMLAHARLVEPWPKVAAVIGAVLAIGVWGVSPAAVLMIFVVGTYLCDSVLRGEPLRPVLTKFTVLGIMTGVALLLLFARMESVELPTYWNQLVNSLIDNLKTLYPIEAGFDWESKRELIRREGPFFLVSALLFTGWVTIGLASHLGWFGKGQGLSSETLRSSLLSPSVGIVFAGLVVAISVLPIPPQAAPMVSGLVDILGALMVVQGTILVSRFLASRGIRKPLRGLVYSFSLTFGLYGLIAVGALGLLVLKGRKSLKAKALLGSKGEL